MYIKPLKSEAIHKTGLSGNAVTSFFPLIIYIYIYIYIFFFFFYIIQTLDTNHSLLHSEWKVRSEKWKLIQNKQTPTPTQTQTETAMRSLPGGKSS